MTAENDLRPAQIEMMVSRWIPRRIARELATDGDTVTRADAKAYADAQTWYRLDDDHASWSSLVMHGPTGTGKTFAACRLVSSPRFDPFREDIGHGRVFSRHESMPGALYVRAYDLAREIMREQFGKPSIVLGWIENCPIIVIDDLGREPSDSSGYMVAGIIDLMFRRFDRLQRTVVATNLDRQKISQRYGSAIEDRMRAHGVVSTLSASDYQRGRRDA